MYKNQGIIYGQMYKNQGKQKRPYNLRTKFSFKISLIEGTSIEPY